MAAHSAKLKSLKHSSNNEISLIRDRSHAVSAKKNLVQLRCLNSLPATRGKLMQEVLLSLKELGFADYLLAIEGPQVLTQRYQLLLSSQADWVEQYANMDQMCAHPFMVQARQQQGVFQWSNKIGQRSRQQIASPLLGPGVSGKTRGLTFSQHLACQGIGILMAVENEAHSANPAGLSDKLETVYAQFSHAVDVIAQTWSQTEPDIHLSPREYQAIYWAAHGKSSNETAKLMQLAEVTVRFHFQAVKAKLQTKNKAESIAKAVSLGLVQL